MSEKPPGEQNNAVRSIYTGTLLRLIRYPFVIAAVALIPRLMGDTAYGQYAYYLSVFLILDIFGDIGFIQIFGRFVPEHQENREPQKLNALIQQSLLFGWCVSSTTISVLVLLKTFGVLPNVPNAWIVLLSVQLFLTQTEGILFSFMYGLNRMVIFSFKEVVRSACTLGFVYLLYLQYGLTGALVGLVLNEAVLMIIAMHSAREFIFTRWQTFSWKAFKPYVFFGLQFYMPAFLYGMIQRTGNVYINEITASSEQVAYYDIANQFLLLIASFMALLISTLLPSLTTFHLRKESASIWNWQRNVLVYCVTIALLIINALLWLGEPVIVIALGEEFRQVWPNAVIISFAFIPVLIAQIGMNYTVIQKQPGVYTRAVLLGFITMTALSLWLIPGLGATGAAWATLAGYALLASVFTLQYWSEFRNILSPLPKVAVAALIMFSVYFIAAGNLHPIVLFTASSLGFVVLLFGFKALRLEELKTFKKMLG